MTTDAVTALRDIREQWGDLLAAIERPPAQEWPPRETRGWLDNGAADAEQTTRPAVGRLPLTLRQHPAPVNLDALDAALSIERGLFDLADRLAAACQRPVRRLNVESRAERYPKVYSVPDAADANDPDRWHYTTVRDIGRAQAASPGSRALGLHWCAVWLERVIAGENPLCDQLGVALRFFAESTIEDAHRDMARALGRDGRATVLPDPCPWCHGELTARTTTGDPYAAVVTCGTGPTCTAPVPYDDQARRAWHGHLLGQLYGALSAARSAV